MSSSDDGLNTKIKAVMEPMINALLVTTPENPVFFMVQWLKIFNNANPRIHAARILVAYTRIRRIKYYE